MPTDVSPVGAVKAKPARPSLDGWPSSPPASPTWVAKATEASLCWIVMPRRSPAVPPSLLLVNVLTPAAALEGLLPNHLFDVPPLTPALVIGASPAPNVT